MNTAQIAKLRKKVAREVADKVDKKNALARKNFEIGIEKMRLKMNDLETQHPNRGPCFCVWNDLTYKKNESGIPKRVPEITPTHIAELHLEMMLSTESKIYYMFTKEAYLENKKFMDWVSKNYAIIKMSVHKANLSEDAMEKLSSMSTLGSLHEEMRKKFPARTISDLKVALHAMDMLLQEEFSR